MEAAGSTLVVNPAASIPLETCHNGGNLVIINDMPTYLDSRAVVRYDDLENAFHYFADHLTF